MTTQEIRDDITEVLISTVARRAVDEVVRLIEERVLKDAHQMAKIREIAAAVKGEQ